MTIELICLDADDTLWHDMRHFDETEKLFFAALEPYEIATVTQHHLEAVVARNLAIHGYGVKSFTLAMVETATELCGASIPAKLMRVILSLGQDLLQHPVELFPGVEAALGELAEIGELVLVTKGDLLHQQTKFATSGISDHFSAIEIVSDKSAETFRSLFKRHGVSPKRCVVAGDSLESDILPALQADAWAAYLPPDFVWFHETTDIPKQHPQFKQLQTLLDLPEWARSID